MRPKLSGRAAAAKPKLTESEWSKVFELRCQAKRGIRLHDDDRALVERAWKEDPKRYGVMEREVFRATIPFGGRDPTLCRRCSSPTHSTEEHGELRS